MFLLKTYSRSITLFCYFILPSSTNRQPRWMFAKLEFCSWARYWFAAVTNVFSSFFYSMAGSALVPNNSPVDVATIGAHFPIFNRLIVFHGRKRFKITLRLFLLRYIYPTHFASVNVLTLIAWLVKIKIFSCVYFNNVCTPQTHTPHCIQYPVINNCRHFRQNSLGPLFYFPFT